MGEDDFLNMLQDCIDDSERVLKQYKRHTTGHIVDIALELFKARVYLSLMRDNRGFPHYG